MDTKTKTTHKHSVKLNVLAVYTCKIPTSFHALLSTASLCDSHSLIIHAVIYIYCTILRELLTLTGIFGQAVAPFQTGQAIVSVDITVLAKGTSTTSGLYRLWVCVCIQNTVEEYCVI